MVANLKLFKPEKLSFKVQLFGLEVVKNWIYQGNKIMTIVKSSSKKELQNLSILCTLRQYWVKTDITANILPLDFFGYSAASTGLLKLQILVFTISICPYNILLGYYTLIDYSFETCRIVE